MRRKHTYRQCGVEADMIAYHARLPVVICRSGADHPQHADRKGGGSGKGGERGVKGPIAG